MADLVKKISFKMLHNFRAVLQEIEQREHLCVHVNLLNLFQNNGLKKLIKKEFRQTAPVRVF
jgi:hypothetical protein